MPEYFEDEFGSALVFDNTDPIQSITDIYNRNYKDLDNDSPDFNKFVEIIKVVRKSLVELNDNGFYHNDAHLGNILYKDNKVYFIDLVSSGDRCGMGTKYEDHIDQYEKFLNTESTQKRKSIIRSELR